MGDIPMPKPKSKPVSKIETEVRNSDNQTILEERGVVETFKTEFLKLMQLMYSNSKYILDNRKTPWEQVQEYFLRKAVKGIGSKGIAAATDLAAETSGQPQLSKVVGGVMSEIFDATTFIYFHTKDKNEGKKFKNAERFCANY